MIKLKNCLLKFETLTCVDVCENEYATRNRPCHYFYFYKAAL